MYCRATVAVHVRNEPRPFAIDRTLKITLPSDPVDELLLFPEIVSQGTTVNKSREGPHQPQRLPSTVSLLLSLYGAVISFSSLFLSVCYPYFSISLCAIRCDAHRLRSASSPLPGRVSLAELSCKSRVVHCHWPLALPAHFSLFL